MAWGSGFTKPGGHYTEITNLQRGLANDIGAYAKLRCDEDDDGGPGFGLIPWPTIIAAARIIDPPVYGSQSTSQSSQTSNSTLESLAVAAALGLLGLAASPAGP
jgi:hypothetical protein